MADQTKSIEYMCTYCNAKKRFPVTVGRPAPGTCPRRPKDRNGKAQPHSWVINRRF